MGENPALTIVRLLGGTVLLQGDLGHQILGQLLIVNSNEVALAGAAAAVAATSGQQNAAAQILIRTALPALAVRALFLKEERRLERREQIVAERERETDELDQSFRTREDDLTRLTAHLEGAHRSIASRTDLQSRVGALQAEWKVATEAVGGLEAKYTQLQKENRALREDVIRHTGLKLPGVIKPPAPSGKTPKKRAAPRTKKRRKPKA